MTQLEASSVQSQVQKQTFATCYKKPEPGTTPYAPDSTELHLIRTQDPPRRNPRKTNRQKYKALISRNLERKRQRLRHLFNRARNTRNETNWDNFKDAQCQYKKVVKQKADRSWRQFCTNKETTDKGNIIRKILVKKNIRTIGSLKKPDGNYTKNDNEVSKTLIETHFPGCKIVDKPEWHNDNISAPTEADWGIANNIVKHDRIRWAIESFHPFKSAGTDRIFPALLQWGENHIIPWLAEIFKACIAYRYIPLTWREVMNVSPYGNPYVQPTYDL
ncbi:jg26212 [Pararge aegeria aegeria]|uniref:Jg26212 protein n=1 Tax=Pararge aegeria aegeria TaxID=348720 RepID=A0A8S4SL64_9NEOP|nr:jg26212 [Pararge aegeria aegeria]